MNEEDSTVGVFCRLQGSKHKKRKYSIVARQDNVFTIFELVYEVELLLSPEVNGAGVVEENGKVSRQSRKVPDHLGSFQTIRKVPRPPGKLLDHLESFQSIRKVSRAYGKFPDHLEVCGF